MMISPSLKARLMTTAIEMKGVWKTKMAVWAGRLKYSLRLAHSPKTIVQSTISQTGPQRSGPWGIASGSSSSTFSISKKSFFQNFKAAHNFFLNIWVVTPKTFWYCLYILIVTQGKDSNKGRKAQRVHDSNFQAC